MTLRVYQVAKDLGVDGQVVLAALGRLGYPMSSVAHSMPDRLLDPLRAELQRPTVPLDTKVRRSSVDGATIGCPCCGVPQNAHINQWGITDRVCGQCISHQGDAAELKRAEKHEEILRERLDAARRAASAAYAERDRLRDQTRAAYDSRERSIRYLRDFAEEHTLRPNGACSCGKRDNCRTGALLAQKWPQQMIRKLDDIEHERQRKPSREPWDEWS